VVVVQEALLVLLVLLESQLLAVEVAVVEIQPQQVMAAPVLLY
jgi:hypothetical protein